MFPKVRLSLPTVSQGNGVKGYDGNVGADAATIRRRCGSRGFSADKDLVCLRRTSC